MKPHPRIRKTIKWGGLTVCILLAGLWAASERWGVHGYLHPWSILLHRGGVGLQHDPLRRYRMPPGWYGRDRDAREPPVWWVGGERIVGRTSVTIPCWMPLTLAAACTATAWRLDTLARRRAKTHGCAKCGYDRAGIAAGAKCPECGTAPTIA